MKSLRSLLAVALIGAMALASTVASAASTATGAVKSFALDMGAAASDAAAGFLRAGGLVLDLVTFADSYTGKYPIRLQTVDSSVNEVAIPFNLPAANPGVNDILALVKVPLGVKIVDWAIAMDDADTGAGLAFSFGSLNSASAPTALTTTYKAGITIGQTSGIQRADTYASIVESAAAERQLGLLFTAAAVGYVAGKTGVLTLKLSDA